MKIIFFGSAHFAVPALEALIKEGHHVACVVTQPDKQKGRHLQLAATEVKKVAVAAKLKVFQPQDVDSKESLMLLKSLEPELFVIVAYGQILSRELLDIPEIMALNIHASLLPVYRGAAPVNWALINGEKRTGVTLIKVTPKMDSGPIISQAGVDIAAGDTAASLEERLSVLGSEMLTEAIEKIKNRRFKLLPQDESKATFAHKLKKEDGLIHWQKEAAEICNLIRGTVPWPGAFTHYQGKLLKICKAQISSPPGPLVAASSGAIIKADKEGLVVAAGKGCLAITQLQPAGARRMSAQEFIIGHKLCAGDKLI